MEKIKKINSDLKKLGETFERSGREIKEAFESEVGFKLSSVLLTILI